MRSHNFAYIMMRHFTVFRRLGYIGYTAIVGEEASPGVAKLVQLWIARRRLEWPLIKASIYGRLDGARAALRAERIRAS